MSQELSIEEIDRQRMQALRVLIARHFSATGEGDPERRSTDDMWRIVESAAPQTFGAGDVYAALTNAGYRTVLIGEELLWEVYRV